MCRYAWFRVILCSEMALFVLLPGAWLDGAVYGPVMSGLQARGHAAAAVTLPGLVDRLPEQPDLERWVATVVGTVTDQGPDGVFLVGHSFSGLVAGAVADRVPDRVDHLIYLDANVPVDGESFADSWSQSGRQWLATQISDNRDRLWPPDLDQSETGLDDVDQRTLLSHAFPMPSPPLYQRSDLSRNADEKVTTSYILCTQNRTELPATVAERVERSNWHLHRLDAGHWPMVSEPSGLVDVLHDIASSRP
jgi:pimeloyl-ACP methyl ester carboxylesterase